MGFIKDKIEEFRNKKLDVNQHRREFMRDRDIENEYERRQLSHYERELMRYKEEKRQKFIKEQVKRIRKQQDRSFWSGKKNNLAYAPNVFQNHKKIFSGKNDFSKQPHLFKKTKVYFLKGKNISLRIKENVYRRVEKNMPIVNGKALCIYTVSGLEVCSTST